MYVCMYVDMCTWLERMRYTCHASNTPTETKADNLVIDH